MGNYSLNSYRSLIYVKGHFFWNGNDLFFQGMNGFVNLILSLNTWIYQIFDLGLQIFLSNDVFDKTVGSVFKVMIAMYNSLFNSVGILIFLIAIFIIFCLFMFKNPNEAMKKMMLLFCIIGINAVIYSNGEDYIKDINALTDDFETQLVKGVTIPTFDSNGEISNKEVNVGDQSSVERIRQAYFTMAVEQPFSMINFGTVQITEEQEKFLYKDSDLKSNKKKEKIDDINGLVEKASEDNIYLTPDSIGDKIFISFYAIINNIFVGGVFLLIAVTKFLLKLLILCMLFLLPIISILSLIPQFGNSIFNALGKILATFLGGAFISLGLFIFYFMMTLIDYAIVQMAGKVDITTCILALFVKVFVITLLYRNSGKILSFVTGGHITNNVNIPKAGLSKGNRRKAETEDSSEEPVDKGNDREVSDDDLTGIVAEFSEVSRSLIDGLEEVANDLNERFDEPDSAEGLNEDSSNEEADDENLKDIETDENDVEELDEHYEVPENFENTDEDLSNELVEVPEEDLEEIEIEKYESNDIPENEEIENIEISDVEEENLSEGTDIEPLDVMVDVDDFDLDTIKNEVETEEIEIESIYSETQNQEELNPSDISIVTEEVDISDLENSDQNVEINEQINIDISENEGKIEDV